MSQGCASVVTTGSQDPPPEQPRAATVHATLCRPALNLEPVRSLRYITEVGLRLPVVTANGAPALRCENSTQLGDAQVITQDEAEQDAAAAAARASVVMAELDTVEGLRGAADLFSRIWETPSVPPMPHDVLRSLVHAGGRVHAAFRDEHLVGAAVAVFSAPADAACYSLIAGVSPAAESRGIGLALKLAQRAWALRAGATRMVWTFDPLLRRNARFNMTRLGAVGTEYLVDFYGEVTDGVNDPETDRLAVTWNLLEPLPALAARSGLLGSPGPDAVGALGDSEDSDTPDLARG